jgi:hypothetical protein
MPETATLPTSGGNPVSGLPLPVKLGLIGGGLGLAVFIWKRSQGGGGGENQSDNAFGIPNTAIMLGSLQQEMLDLKGEVGYGTVTISDLVTGGFENLGAQIDAQTAAWQSGLGVLQTNITDNQNANTLTIVNALKQGSDVLATLIGNNAAAQMAANQSFAQSLTAGLDSITAFHNAELAAVNALGSNVSTNQAALIAQLGGLQTQLTNAQNAIANIPAGSPQPSIPALNWSIFNMKKLFSNVDQRWYTVVNGNIMEVSFWDTTPGRPFDDRVQETRVDVSLSGMSKGQWQAPR